WRFSGRGRAVRAVRQQRSLIHGPVLSPEMEIHWSVKVEQTVAVVKEIGAQNFILATDLGQMGNPSPPDGLQLFVTDLMKAGLGKDQIMTMGRDDPWRQRQPPFQRQNHRDTCWRF